MRQFRLVTSLAAAALSLASVADAQVPLARRGGIDLDGLGKSAIVVRSSSARMMAGRLVNNAFQWATLTDPGAGYNLIAAVDLDGNGKSDLVFQTSGLDDLGRVTVFAWPDFQAAGQYTLRAVKPAWFVQATGDLDGDGHGDIVFRFTGDDGTPNDTGVSYTWFQKAGGAYDQLRKRGGAPLNWQLVGAADLNGDGAADMVYLNPFGQFRVLMATPARTCANLAAGSIPTGYSALRMADFTGNGRGDVLVRDASGNTALVSLNATGIVLPPFVGNPDDVNVSCTSSGATVTNTVINLPATDPTWGFYAAGDFDGNGVFDIVWQHTDGTLTVWLMGQGGIVTGVLNNDGTASLSYTVLQEGGSGATGVAGPQTYGPANIDSAVGATVQSSQTVYVRVDLTGAVFGATVSAAALSDLTNSTHITSILLAQAGSIGNGFVVFQVTSAASGIPALDTLRFQMPLVNLDGSGTTPAITYSLHSTAASAAGSAPLNNARLAVAGPANLSTLAPGSAAKAEGVYTGTASNGVSFETIVLDNDQFWTIYGMPNSIGGLTVYGLVQGSGTSSNGSYVSTNARDYFYTGDVTPSTVNASYIPSTSLSGLYNGTAFNGTKPVSSSYVYTNPAQLSDISGNWSGSLYDGSAASLTISSTGTFTGTSNGCSFTGTILPRASGKNVFDVSLTFGGFPCIYPGQVATGVGGWSYISANVKELLITGVLANRSAGTVFFANR